MNCMIDTIMHLALALVAAFLISPISMGINLFMCIYILSGYLSVHEKRIWFYI